MPDRTLQRGSYKKLVTDIVRLFEGVHRSLVEAGWKTGQWLVEVEQEGDVRATRGDQLVSRLSEDLTRRLGPGFSVQSLRRMRRFYLDNPKRSPASVITWAHHIELLPIRDKKIRLALERRTVRDELDRDGLRALVRHERVREQVAENRRAYGALRTAAENAVPLTPYTELLVPTRGTLYAYRILDPKTVQPKEDGLLLVDLGFSCYRDLDAVTSKIFKPSDIVESVKVADDDYKLQKSEKTEAALFTYQAIVEKIVDGDTLRVVVDLGFNTRTRQYLRLRGIDSPRLEYFRWLTRTAPISSSDEIDKNWDCPEIDTEEGKKAADFVKSRIRTTDQIVLTSFKSDKYDRYLADVFYSDKDGNEVYLNNQLLESGLAVGL